MNYLIEQKREEIRERITNKYKLYCKKDYLLTNKDYQIIKEAVDKSIDCLINNTYESSTLH